MAERDEFGAFLIGFIIGGLTGAAISLIMAPQSGEETREFLKDRSIELRDKAMEASQTARDQIGSTASDVRSRAGDLADKAKTSADDLRQRGQVVLEEQRNKIQNMRNRSGSEGGETTI